MAGKKETWYERVADRIVRESVSFPQAAALEGLALTTDECEKYQKRREFQRVLQAKRNHFYAELGTEPSKNKNVLVGQMIYCINQLIRGGDYKDALDGILKQARVEGFVGGDQEVNVFGGLSAKEFDQLRDVIQTKKQTVETPPKELVN